MNVDRMRAVANLIELEDRFYYPEWTQGVDDVHYELVAAASRLGECGTTGCVAGWATFLGLREGFRSDAADSEHFAAEFLGLALLEADRLFYGDHFHSREGGWKATTAVEVAKFMRAVADGETTL